MLRQTSTSLRVLLLLLMIGLLGMLTTWVAGIDSSDPSDAVSAPAYSTMVEKLDFSNLPASATPFQPLPTNTLTSTPVPTNTPVPTFTLTPLPAPTFTPPSAQPFPVLQQDLPAEAFIEGVTGHAQSYPLTCEARSAVDWAGYFGVSINEMEFQSALPLSDNPELGFVGNIDGYQGQIPPQDYGVYAPPVASLLREYGLKATAVKDYSSEKLKKQVARGNPVIVWVVGNVWDGTPLEYTTKEGSTVTVAPYEHTAIVVGYDGYGFTLIDNDLMYWRDTDTFLASWGVLGNTAIIAK
ncbi:MAG: C39 family peptidase [Anaerolineaceae bacterium]